MTTNSQRSQKLEEKKVNYYIYLDFINELYGINEWTLFKSDTVSSYCSDQGYDKFTHNEPKNELFATPI